MSLESPSTPSELGWTGAVSAADARRSMLTGSVWMVAMRWTIRGIGLISTVLLARILLPADFGLVAMAMLVVSFVEVFGETGQRLAILRHAAPDRQLLDTAWTLSVCQGVVLAVVMILMAPYAAAYFHEPRIEPLIRFLSLRAFVGGFENIGIIRFRREFEFAHDFRFNVYQKLLMFFTTVGIALYWRSHWALAAGIVAGRVLSTVISYRMVAYRPRFSVARLKEIWAYSNWMLLVSLGDLFQRKTGEFIVGRVFGPTTMGQFTVADDLAQSPTAELVVPASRALFPAFARLVHDRVAFTKAFLVALSGTAAVCSAIGVGLALVADDLVPLVLGPQWTMASSLLPWLAVTGVVSALMSTMLTGLNVDGHAQWAVALVWMRNGALALLIGLAALWTHQLEALAIAQLVAFCLLLLPSFWVTGRSIPVHWREFASALWSPAAASILMAGAVLLASWSFQAGLPRLVTRVGTGCAVYTVTLMLFWHWRGRPPGIEGVFHASILRVLQWTGLRTVRVDV